MAAAFTIWTETQKNIRNIYKRIIIIITFEEEKIIEKSKLSQKEKNRYAEVASPVYLQQHIYFLVCDAIHRYLKLLLYDIPLRRKRKNYAALRLLFYTPPTYALD